jgi:hypothetical protein
MEPKITDTYLPKHCFAEVEGVLARYGGSMSVGLIDADAVEREVGLKLAASPIDHCVRNLTHGFPDNPTYFALSEALSLNAVIGRFSNFQCVIITWEFYKRATIFWNSLLVDKGLVNFLKSGSDPDEPDILPVKNRGEALAELLSNDISNDETALLGIPLNYLFMYILASHEVGHLALGHLHRSANAYIDEMGPTKSELRISSRAREWDADGFALGATLYLTGSDFAKEPFVKDLLVSKEANLRIVFVVAYALFILLDEASPQDRPLEERTHPRPLVRVGLASLAVSRLLHMLGAMDASEALDTARRAIRAVEIAVLHLAGGVMEPSLAKNLTAELAAEADRLSASFNDQLETLDRSRIGHYAWAGPLSQPMPILSGENSEIG